MASATEFSVPRIGADSGFNNYVLRAIDDAARDFLRARLIVRELRAGEVVLEQGVRPDHAIFVESGVISIISPMENGRMIEKVSVGMETYFGFPLALGIPDFMAPNACIVQVPGSALLLPIADLREALVRFPSFMTTTQRSAFALLQQTMQAVACTSLHSATQRISRWLLLAHDRCHSDELDLTQQALSDILGLRRATVSNACSEMQASGVITYRRGSMMVLDRMKLEALACECYRQAWRAGLLPLLLAEQERKRP